jgi:hypothetical protein
MAQSRHERACESKDAVECRVINLPFGVDVEVFQVMKMTDDIRRIGRIPCCIIEFLAKHIASKASKGLQLV